MSRPPILNVLVWSGSGSQGMYDGAPSELHASLGTLATMPGGVNAREINVSRGRREMERRIVVNRGAMIADSAKS